MAAPIDAGSIYSDVRIRLDKLNGDIKSVKTSLDKITKASTDTAKKSQKGLGKFFSFIKTSGVGSFLALSAVIAGTVKFLKDSEAAASDAQEVYSKFDTVFESIQDSANNAADSFAESFGVAGSTARELIGATGDLLVGMGATEDTALDLSMQVQELAADLASFSNVQGGTKRASEALTAALLGETERMKLLGVVIRQSDVQQRLMEKGQDKLTGQALMLAKAQITLAMATEQSGKALGDSQKTFYSAANVTKRLKETQKALREEVGIGIVEAMTPLRIATDKLIRSFTGWLKKNREIKDAMKEINDTGESTVGSIITLEAALKIATKALADDSTGIIESVAVYESRITAIQNQINAIKALDAAKLNTIRFEEQYANEISIVNARLLLKAKQEEEAAKFTAERIRQQEELGKAFKAIAEKQALYGDEFDARAAKEQAVRQVLNEMIEFGFTAEGAGIKRVLKQYEEYFTTVSDKKKEEREIAEYANQGWWEDEQAKVEHLIWIDELETEINERRLAETEERQRKEREAIQERIAMTFEYANAVMGIFNAINDLQSANANAELARMEKNGATEEEIAERKKELAIEEAKRGKKLALLNIAINAASAVVAALVSIPPNVPLSIAVGITGAIQAAAVLAEPIPSFATGGIVLPSSGGSLVNVAENGSPELMLNGGASGQAMMQEFADMLNDMKGGGNQVFYLMLPNGKVLAEAVAPSFNNGIVPLRLT